MPHSLFSKQSTDSNTEIFHLELGKMLSPPPTPHSGNHHRHRPMSNSSPTTASGSKIHQGPTSSSQLPYVTLVSVLVAIVLASTRIPAVQALAPSAIPHTAKIRSMVSSSPRTSHIKTQSRVRQTILKMSPQEDSRENMLPPILETTGRIAPPVVWISLYKVATTGAGLPAGPFGLVGALEGVSYLLMVGLAGSALLKSNNKMSLAQKLSLGTLALGLLTLVKLVADEGCVPNAKPILDYSAFVKVCNPEDGTPGLFGD